MSTISFAKILDPNRSGTLTYRMRQQRNEEFKRRFPDLADMRILDLGGTAAFWKAQGLTASGVTLVNLDHKEDPEEPWIELRREDACQGGFGKFDLVLSNSLMEHVGGHARRQQFADVIRESAPNWWVQTPYRYFPIEPHFLFPGFQFLPFRSRVFVTQHWGGGHAPVLTDRAMAAEIVAWIELISVTEMRAYFPESEIWFERFAGIPKSMVAISSGS